MRLTLFVCALVATGVFAASDVQIKETENDNAAPEVNTDLANQQLKEEAKSDKSDASTKAPAPKPSTEPPKPTAAPEPSSKETTTEVPSSSSEKPKSSSAPEPEPTTTVPVPDDPVPTEPIHNHVEVRDPQADDALCFLADIDIRFQVFYNGSDVSYSHKLEALRL